MSRIPFSLKIFWSWFYSIQNHGANIKISKFSNAQCKVHLGLKRKLPKIVILQPWHKLGKNWFHWEKVFISFSAFSVCFIIVCKPIPFPLQHHYNHTDKDLNAQTQILSTNVEFLMKFSRFISTEAMEIICGVW